MLSIVGILDLVTAPSLAVVQNRLSECTRGKAHYNDYARSVAFPKEGKVSRDATDEDAP